MKKQQQTNKHTNKQTKKQTNKQGLTICSRCVGPLFHVTCVAVRPQVVRDHLLAMLQAHCMDVDARADLWGLLSAKYE